MTPPVFIPLALPDESPLSLLHRASHGNHWPSVAELLKALCGNIVGSGGFASMILWPHHFREICRQLGIPDETITTVAYDRACNTMQSKVIYRQLRVSLGSLSIAAQRYCPACVLASRHARDMWTHRLGMVCGKHGCWLITESFEDQREFSLLHHDWPTAEKLGIAASNVRPAPEHCLELFSGIVESGDQSGLDRLDTCLSITKEWSEWGLLRSDSETVFAAACDLFQSRWPRDLCGVPPGGGAAAPLHPRSALYRLVTSGERTHRDLGAALLRSRGHRPLSAFVTKHVALPTEDVVRLVGIPRKAAIALAFTWLPRIAGTTTVSLLDCNRLLSILSARHHPQGEVANVYRFRNQLVGRSTAMLIEDLMSEGIAECIFESTLGLSSLRIAAAALPKTVRRNDELLLADVARICGVHSESIRFLSKRTNWLSSMGTKGRGVKYRFTSESVDAFSRDYVFAGALAKELRVGRTTMTDKLRSAGIKPVSGPGIDGGLTYLFRREDLRKADLRAIADSEDYVSRSGRRPHGSPANIRTDGLELQDAADQLGMRAQTCRRLLRMKILHRIHSTGRAILVSKESFERCKAMYAETLLTESAAAQRFGQTALQFRRAWVDTRIIRPVVLVGKRGFRENDLFAISKVLEGGRLANLWVQENGYSKGHAQNRLRKVRPGPSTSSPMRFPTLLTDEDISILSSTNERLRRNVVIPAP